jgi:hypothetical protein
MPRKRKPVKTPKGDKLIPLRDARKRSWYHAPLRAAANGLESLFSIFRRRPKPIVQKKPPRAAQRRRKN